jgi:hypothetical protein
VSAAAFDCVELGLRDRAAVEQLLRIGMRAA